MGARVRPGPRAPSPACGRSACARRRELEIRDLQAERARLAAATIRQPDLHAGSPFTCRVRFSVDLPWRTRANSRIAVTLRAAQPAARSETLCLNGRVETQVEARRGSDPADRGRAGTDAHHAVEHATSDLAAPSDPRLPARQVPAPILSSGRQGANPRRGRRRATSPAALERCRSRADPPIAEPEYDYERPSADETAGIQRDGAGAAEVEISTGSASRCRDQSPRCRPSWWRRRLKSLRDSIAELIPTEGREARDGDTLVIEIVSPDGSEHATRWSSWARAGSSRDRDGAARSLGG